MALDSTTVISHLAETLLAARNADGGWGYSAGKASRLEPTCWATLALFESGAEFPVAQLGAGLALLSRWQHPDGLLSDITGVPPNLAFNGLAALVIRRVRERRPAGVPSQKAPEERLLAGLLTLKGVRLEPTTHTRQDNRLQGWPWIDQTFSWVEPTAWCLLAVKRAKQTLGDARCDARIDEANRLLADRCCQSGGWNFGSSNTLGKELYPYVPTTALGLLALQDRRETGEVVRSLTWLREHGTQEASRFALSLALIAAWLFREPVGSIEEQLIGQFANAASFDNLAVSGMALFALTGSRHGTEAVRLQ